MQFDYIFLLKSEFYSWDPLEHKPSLVHMMAWHWIGVKPLSAPTTSLFIIVSLGIQASLGLKGLKYRIVLDIPCEIWLTFVSYIYNCPDVTIPLVIFWFKSEIYSWDPLDHRPSFGSHSGLALNRHQAIFCTNGATVLWRIHASFGRNGLNYRIVLDVPCGIWYLCLYIVCTNILNVLVFTRHQTSLCGLV